MFKIRDWLYIGKWQETTDYDLLTQFNIGAMLQLAGEVPQPHITHLYLPVEDGATLPLNLLREGVDFICHHKAQGKKVLSACGAGISRSTTFAMGALMREEALSVWEAYATILEKHAHAMPHPELCRALLKQNGVEVSIDDMIRQLMTVVRQRRTL